MTKDEALKMAIDYLELQGFSIERQATLEACKEAILRDVTDIDVGEIAQPAQELSKLEMAGFDLDGVIADGYREGLDNVSLSTIKRVRKTISDYVAQPAQEPVAVCKDSIVNWVNGKAIDGWLYTHPAPHPAQEPVLNVEKIISEFPLLDDEGLDEDKHHCEWAIQQDRKRLHAMIKNTHPAPSWQGLTDDDKKKLHKEHHLYIPTIEKIESMLKEKNHEQTN